MTEGTGGHHVRAMYKHEDSGFDAAPSDGTWKPFGGSASFNQWSGTNNALAVMQPGSRDAAQVIEQHFEGAWGIQGQLTNAWWLKEALHGTASTTGTAAPYTHVYDGEDPLTMQIYTYDEQNDVERVLGGCPIAQLEVSAQVDGPAQFTLTGAYASDDSTEAPASPNAQPALAEDVLSFHDATVERPGGTVLSLTQQASFQLQNNTELVRELGTRTAVDAIHHQRQVTVDYGDVVHNTDNVSRMYGSSAATTVQSDMDNRQNIVLNFDNGDTGSDRNAIKLTAKSALPDGYDVSGAGDPGANLEGQLSEMAASVSATLENSEASAL